jgi:hypothetical protein
VTIAGFVAYFVATTQLAVFRRIPWESLAVMALGVALGVAAWWRRPRLATRASALLSSAVLAFALWFFFSFSMLPAREDRPAVGDTFPDFALPTSTGGTFQLAAAPDRRHLIVL